MENKIKKVLKFFFILVVPIFFALGRVLDEVVHIYGGPDTSMYFILPLFAGIVMAIVLARTFHKGFGYIAGFAVTFTLLIVCLSYFVERYPLATYATYSRERQTELDEAKQTEAPFVESLRALYEDDTLSYRKTLDSAKIILADKEKGKDSANAFIRRQALKLKQERDYTDSTEMIIKSIGNKDHSEVKNTNSIISSDVSNNYQRTFSSSGTKEILHFGKSGDVKKTSKIYLAPGQRIRVFATTNCKIYNSKISVTPREWESFDQTIEGLVSVEGIGKKGSITIEVM
jgi:hypothetical protein